MTTGITTTETWHGDHGTSLRLPAGTRVRLETSNEVGSDGWQAFQISGPKWRVLGGVYLRSTQVNADATYASL